jgi:hypothetical protein
MCLLVPVKELSVHYTDEIEEVVLLVGVVAEGLGVVRYREPGDRIRPAEPGLPGRREVLVGFPVELEPLVELGSVLDELGKGEAAPVALLRDPVFVLPLPELVEEDVGQFFESSSLTSSRKSFWSWA